MKAEMPQITRETNRTSTYVADNTTDGPSVWLAGTLILLAVAIIGAIVYFAVYQPQQPSSTTIIEQKAPEAAVVQPQQPQQPQQPTIINNIPAQAAPAQPAQPPTVLHENSTTRENNTLIREVPAIPQASAQP